MDVILAQLASAAAAIIAPFMPYLVEGGKEFAGKAGEAAWTKAEKIWSSIKSYFGDDLSIKGASLLLSQDPQADGMQAMLAKALATKLESNPESVKELMDLIGGREAMQEALIENSWVGEVVQELSGTGTQSTRLKDSTVGRVHQKKF